MADQAGSHGRAWQADFPASSDEFPSSVFDTDDRVLVGMPEIYPWSSIGRVTASAGGTVLSGTGFMISPFHMLTAGHTVENALFPSGTAENVSVVFGSDGETAPFGTLTATGFRTVDAWSVDRLPEADWALVTLDRAIGGFTGFMGLGTQPGVDFYDGASVTLAGFPADLGSGRELYAAAGPVASGSAGQLFYSGTLDTAGGMSGAPIWRTFSSTGRREVIGVHTTGALDPDAPGATNAGTRLTAEILGLIAEWSDLDAILAPPVDRPDLTDADAALGTDAAGLSAAAVSAGDEVLLEFEVYNRGTASAGASEVAIYASLNDTITTSDILLATTTVPAIGPFERAPVSVSLAVPVVLPGASYHVGWVLDAAGAVTELDESDNTVLLADTLAVTGAPDLVARALAVPAAWTQGESVSASWEVVSVGGAVAAGGVSTLMLSADAVLDGADQVLLSDGSVPDLAPSAVAAAGGSFTVPAGLASGVYHIFALADAADEVAEADEANNASVLIVSIGRPGLSLGGDGAANALFGGPDDDTLSGGGGNDTLSGQEGADSLTGDGDDDVLNGNAGQDTLVAGPGLDTLRGHEGPDLLIGDFGDPALGQADLAFGGPGNDTLRGDGGPDTLFGEADDDLLDGGGGFDLLNGNAGNDTLLGGALRDTLDGEAGDDSIVGGSGNDLLVGDIGDDTLDGGPGPDFFDAGPGADLILGGDDDDIVLGRDGPDSIEGGAGVDRIQAGEGDDVVDGGSGDDRLFGEAGADMLHGGAGNDLVFGHTGDDSLTGGPGNDSLIGDDGRDTIEGGSGDDLIAGREGEDDLAGGEGDDIVDGDAGADGLAGGPGADVIFGRAGPDTLSGGDGDDFLAGGSEDDVLEGGPGADRLGGDGGADSFVFRSGDGGDFVFDLVLGTDTVLFVGGAASFDGLTFGTGEGGWVSVGYSSELGDMVTFQGLAQADLSDDGTFLFA